MDKFDRELQREFLLALYSALPDGIDHLIYEGFKEKFGGELNLIANLNYLEGHGLLSCEITLYIDGDYQVNTDSIKITSKGIDFIRDDGGLGAILNVVNIRLHNDTISRLEAIISASNAPPEDKTTLISTLLKLPADSIKHLNMKLLDAGLAHLPNVFHAIQSAMQGL
ncbi:hypothetical protein BK025_02795 [Sodalis sp. TME1]|nr:hypothetical protein BK025_02795 [Sodalis sp. TME1]